MADHCICRTDGQGQRWTNTACRVHGADSAADDEPSEEAVIARLMGRDL